MSNAKQLAVELRTFQCLQKSHNFERFSWYFSRWRFYLRSGNSQKEWICKSTIIADKGFTVQDLLPLGVSLNLPPFLGASSQMAAEDVVKTQETASLRIHVEPAFNKTKNFQIWDRVVPQHQMRIVNQMWAVCAFCCNAQPNIISM